MIYKLLNKSQSYPLNLSTKYLWRTISGINSWGVELTTDNKHKIEDHWRSKFNTQSYKFDENDLSKPRYYVLSMFPYPSGQLHMGHVRVYTISDSIARYQHMNGKNVIHPIGWDAFGLPAENAAIDRKISPEKWTNENIMQMKKQLKHLGCSFEWHRELATSNPKYYKWTQELFLKLLENDLAYQKEALVNWDPVDCTVLADEQVDENGCSWRSGAKVEKKLLKQWFIKTTKYAKALQDGLDDSILQDWRDVIKIQKHWIGECNGIAVDFQIENSVHTMWTDIPERLEEVKFITVNETHLLSRFSCQILDENTKILNAKAKNPITNEEVPIYVTNLFDYGHGNDSRLGIPCVNSSDEEFALKYRINFENALEIQNIEEKRDEIIAKLKNLNLGGHYTSSKLRDWLISRQRYWGTPIPIIHCSSCGPVPVPRDELPVLLPANTEQCSSKSDALLHFNEAWRNTKCPKCDKEAQRETDTMDTFVDSSWYFLRYLDVNCKDMFDVERAKKLTPVDLYIGGKEHAALHLYYARFVSHFLHSLGMLPEREPFKRLLVQGMVMGRSYRIKGTGKYLPEDQVDVIDVKKNKATCKETGQPVVMQWEKMSKSKLNGVDPEDMFRKYGVDTTRLLILADVAPTSHRNWNSNTFPGVINWQRRLWLTIEGFIKHRTDMPEISSPSEHREQDDYMFDSRNYYIKGVTFNYCDSQQISVAISKLQGFTNSIRRATPDVVARSLQFQRALSSQIVMLAPLAPHFASELWSGFLQAPNRLDQSDEVKWDGDVLEQNWPVIDGSYNMELIFQINGVQSGKLKIPSTELDVLHQDDAIKLALAHSDVQSILENRKVYSVKYTLFKGYEGVVNIVASGHPPQVKETKVQKRQSHRVM